MSENNLLTNDQLQSEIRDGYPDSVDFFVGNKISIEKKETEEETIKKDEDKGPTPQEEDETDVAGLEALILGFSKPRNIISFEDITGQEGIGDTAKSILAAIWKFIKDIGDWIYNLFNNKIARIDARTRYTEQRRKVNGIKDKPVKYLASVKSLLVPSMVSSSPTWVSNVVKEAESFYKRVIVGHKALKDFIYEKPNSESELTKQQENVLNSLGRIITENSPKNGVYQTTILPGNRVFNIFVSTAKNSSEIKTYFTDSAAAVSLKSDTWTPTVPLIDDAINTLNSFRNTILKEQRNASTLLKSFSQEIEKAIKSNKKISKETRAYYIWLGNINKRLTNSSLQYATYCIESLDDFINSGLK